MGLQGQPAIIVLMDQQKSCSVHSRSELSQGQHSELEPGLAELNRFRINAIRFVLFCSVFFFFAHFYMISLGQGEIENRLAVSATHSFQKCSRILTQYCP